jgi:hypothetical protein
MRPVLLPDGHPGEHLGISHTLKHYLDPREMWEDLAGDLEERLRPSRVAARLFALSAEPWRLHAEEGRELEGVWNSLRVVYRKGYAGILLALAEELPEPMSAGSPWVSDKKGAWLAHLDDGVVLRVRWGRYGWRMETAFRPVDFKLTSHACPPRDARNVAIRRAMARHQAERHLARFREEDSA